MENELKEITPEEITPEQALNTLYAAARKISLDADGHELLKLCHKIVSSAIEVPSVKVKEV